MINDKYPYFNKYSFWKNDLYSPITKKEINKKNIKNKIPNLIKPLSLYYRFFVNGAKLHVKNMNKYGDVISAYYSKYLVISLYSPQSVHEVTTLKSKSFEKGPLWNRAKKLIGDGVFLSEEPKHFQSRRIILPAFTHKKMMSYCNVMIEKTNKKIDNWKNNNIKKIDMYSEATNLTLDIISECMYGVNVSDKSEYVKNNLTKAIVAMERTFPPSLYRYDFFDIPIFKGFKKSTMNLYDFAEDIYEKKLNTNLDGNDLLSVLMNSTYEDNTKLTKSHIIDEIITAILAGFETTANTLTWCIAYLNEYPEEYDKLIEEAKDIFNNNLSNEEIIKKIMEAPVVDSIIKETLRLIPPIWQIPRIAKEDVIIDNNYIPKGSFVILSPYATHRRKDIYSDPEKFIPSRWTKEFKDNLPNGAYFPFSDGSRRCIGEQFALIELKVILLKFSQFLKIEIDGDFPIPEAAATYRPAISIKSKIKYH